MFFRKKQNLPSLFLRFGIDDHGTVVPFLKRNKTVLPHLASSLKPLPLPEKSAAKAS